MKKSDLSKLGVLLIVLSFICMGGGFVVTYVDKSYVFTPPDSILGQSDGITISTVDDETTGDVDVPNDNTVDGELDNNDDVVTDSDNDKSDSNGDKKPSSDKDTGKNNGSTGSTNDSGVKSGQSSDVGSSGNTTNPNPTPEPTPVPEPQPEPTPAPSIEETNNALRNEIQNTYGIKIKYGNEISGYTLGGMTTVMLSDPYVIQSALNSVKSTIALYPLNIWREMSGSGYPLNIYLIKKYSTENVTGVTESFSNRVNISIAMDFSFAETFNHEVFHYFENFITKFKGASWDTWNSFNPNGFVYGSTNSNLSYSQTYNAGSYFVNNYAQTQAPEDRASTFEYMMFNSKASCLNNGQPVWNKAKFMASQLETYFNSVSPYVIEYWERHL